MIKINYQGQKWQQ